MRIFENSSFTPALMVALLTSLISGCGGSSSDTSSQTSVIETPDSTYKKQSIVVLENTVNSQQGVDLLLYYPNETVSNIQWQQTSGSDVTFLAKNSKVISFTPTQNGSYGFSVNFTVNGSQKTLSASVDVNSEIHKVTARLSHAVMKENKVSLRVQLASDVDQSSINWNQVSGPQVTFTNNDSSSDVSGDLAVFFNAPNVQQDTIIAFDVSATANGQSYSDKVSILVEATADISSNAYFDNRLAKVFPYNANSPYADNLVNCIYSNQLSSSCTLNKLPLIAKESTLPTIENIMDRVVVSHQWMGDRFKEFLENKDINNDFKRLLRATTGIVISYDVRPSFYWAATGAIYLDASNFWLTPQERDTINEAPDYRSSFGNDLQFVMPWRYVKDNNYANNYIGVEERVNRTTDDGLYRLVSLMYHELAHANDFFPRNEWFIHSNTMRVLDAANDSNFESDSLAIAYPLQSSEMRALANVSFGGNTASNTQKSYLPTDIKTFFSTDNASDFYNYSSEREDYAMLFEELMMQSRYGIFRDVAITNKPTSDKVQGSDYIVTWGQRGRIGEATLKPRVLFSASRVLPEFDSATALDHVPAPILMTAGDDWIENLPISLTSTNQKVAGKTFLKEKKNQQKNNLINLQDISSEDIRYPYHHKALPQH